MNNEKRIIFLESQLTYLTNKLNETRKNQIETISKYDFTIADIVISYKRAKKELAELKLRKQQ